MTSVKITRLLVELACIVACFVLGLNKGWVILNFLSCGHGCCGKDWGEMRQRRGGYGLVTRVCFAGTSAKNHWQLSIMSEQYYKLRVWCILASFNANDSIHRRCTTHYHRLHPQFHLACLLSSLPCVYSPRLALPSISPRMFDSTSTHTTC